MALEAQVEERPLAKKQEALQGIANGSEKSAFSSNTSTDATNAVTPTEQPSTDHPRKALLKNDDVELRRVGEVRESMSYSDSYVHLIFILAARRSPSTFLRCLQPTFARRQEQEARNGHRETSIIQVV
jgi:hypothetical protein